MVERLLPLSEVLTIVPMSKASLYRWIESGRFPAPVKLGRRSVWAESAVRQFVDSIVAQSGQQTPVNVSRSDSQSSWPVSANESR